MAKPKITPPKKLDIAEAASNVEVPRIKWKVIGAILGGFAILWFTALMMMPAIGYWGVGVMGVLTVVAIGLGIYVFRMTQKQREILDIMKGAQGEAGRVEVAADDGGCFDRLGVLGVEHSRQSPEGVAGLGVAAVASYAATAPAIRFR